MKAGTRGFTMIEAVIAITIMGILAAMVAVFIRQPVEGYVDGVRRAELSDAADGVLRRIARDVRAALPNSLRTTAPASNQCFEFIPVIGSGRYRLVRSSIGPSDPLDFSAADASFDVLASSGLPALNSAANIYHVVIYNLGIPGADAYEGSNRARVTTSSTSLLIKLTPPGKQFPLESPRRTFHLIPNTSVVYACSGGQITRSTYALSAAKLAGCPPAGAVSTTVLVDNVNCANTSFDYVPADSQRSGLLTMQIELTQSGESARLYQEVHVNNAP